MVGSFEIVRKVLFIFSIFLFSSQQEEIVEEIIFVINGIPTTKLEFLEKYEKSKLHWGILKRSGVKTGKFPNIQDFASSMVEEILVQQEVDSQSVKVRDEDVINNIRTSIMEPQKIASMDDFKSALSIQGLEWDYFFQEHRKRMYQNFFLEKIAATKDITHEEIQDYYKKKSGEFVVREKLIRLSQVFVKISPTATFTEMSQINGKSERLRQQIISGEKDFFQVAKEYSRDSLSGENGGDIGWVGEEDFSSIDKTWQAIKSCKKGDISRVIKISDGFIFFRIDDILTKGKMPFERAKNIIKYKLREIAAMGAYKQKLEELRTKSTIKIYTNIFGPKFSL